jgi:hypothetical protein
LYFCPRDRKTGARKSLPYYFNKQVQDKLETKGKYISMGLALGHQLETLEKQWEEQYGEDQ